MRSTKIGKEKKSRKKKHDENSFTCTIACALWKTKEHLLLSNEMCVTFTAAILTATFPQLCALFSSTILLLRCSLFRPVTDKTKEYRSLSTVSYETRSKRIHKEREIGIKTNAEIRLNKSVSSYFVLHFIVLMLCAPRKADSSELLRCFASSCH